MVRTQIHALAHTHTKPPHGNITNARTHTKTPQSQSAEKMVILCVERVRRMGGHEVGGGGGIESGLRGILSTTSITFIHSITDDRCWPMDNKFHYFYPRFSLSLSLCLCLSLPPPLSVSLPPSQCSTSQSLPPPPHHHHHPLSSFSFAFFSSLLLTARNFLLAGSGIVVVLSGRLGLCSFKRRLFVFSGY